MAIALDVVARQATITSYAPASSFNYYSCTYVSYKSTISRIYMPFEEVELPAADKIDDRTPLPPLSLIIVSSAWRHRVTQPVTIFTRTKSVAKAGCHTSTVYTAAHR